MMRIFIGLTEVSGYYANLSRGFEELGIQSLHVPLQEHRFRYADISQLPLPARVAGWCVKQRVAVPQSAPTRRWLWLVLVLLTRLLLFAWALTRFDVFILGGGSGFFRLRELPLLRMLGKRIVYVFHGTDARPAYIDGFFHELPPFSQSADIATAPERGAIAKAYVRASRGRKRDLARIERWAHAVVCGASWGQFLTRPFFSFLAIGIPMRIDRKPEGCADAATQRIRILHAPSQRDAKGTLRIRAAVKSLKNKGLLVEYVEVSGRPNAEVLAEIARSDFVIDQLYSDTPMAGFATEAAAIGKPAVVGSYYADRLSDELPAGLIPPTLCCHPDDIERAAERLVRDSTYRLELGRAAQEFVTSRWSARAVAERFMRMIDDTAPAEWTYDPARQAYLEGVGLPEWRVRQNVQAIVDTCGISALQLDDTPALRDLFLAFGRGARSSC